MLTRRETFALLGGVTLTACAIGIAQESATPLLSSEDRWLTKLGQGLPEEFDYAAEIEGRLPPGLVGTLYRNGPGLFERDGFRKLTVLDGDGMIRATTFDNGGARFRNRFVRTEKYVREEKAGQFLYPTWTSPAPGLFDNIPCIPTQSQAGITPVIKNGVLYAFDEMGNPYGLNPQTLETIGAIDPYDSTDENRPASYKAHTKTDAETGNWILVGGSGQINPRLHVLVKNSAGRSISHVSVPTPRRGFYYYHDFFWTGRYVVFHLHPAVLSPLPMLTGFSTFADSLNWRPAEGGLLLVVDPTGDRPPITIETEACWMWHALNAYGVGDTIVAEFVGYDAPDHFLGPDAALRAIMQGRGGIAKSPGTLRRITIELAGKRAHMETIVEGHFEFPIVAQTRVGRRHRYAYVASGPVAEKWFHNGVARIDTETGTQAEFRFGPGHYVGEPVFVPDPSVSGDSPAAEDNGWLVCEVLEASSGKSFMAVFDASHLSDGPVAKARLRHHLPMSFHGWWEAA